MPPALSSFVACAALLVAAVAGAAPRYVQGNCGGVVSTGSSLQIALPGVRQGSLLVAAVHANFPAAAVASLTDSSGATLAALRARTATPNSSSQTFSGLSDGGDVTVTATLSAALQTGQEVLLYVHEYEAHGALEPMAVNSGVSDMPWVMATTAAADDLVYVDATYAGSLGAGPSNFTIRQNCRGDVTGDATFATPGVQLISFVGGSGPQEFAVGAVVIHSSSLDAGAVDAGAVDAGAVDAGAVDAGAVDAGAVDAGAPDSGRVDAGLAADAGDEPPKPYRVGCGCSGSGSSGPWGLLLLCLSQARRAALRRSAAASGTRSRRGPRRRCSRTSSP